MGVVEEEEAAEAAEAEGEVDTWEMQDGREAVKGGWPTRTISYLPYCS